MSVLAPAAPAGAASGIFDRAWGKDVIDPASPGNTGTGVEICVAASGHICKAGTTGGLGGELNGAAGVAADPAGNVFVADTANNRIQKFDSAGNFLRAWGKDVVDPSSPSGDTGTGFEICVAASGHVCKAGATGGLGGELNGPDDVATDSAGNVYVADDFNHRIQKFDSAGVFQRAWGKDVVDPSSPTGNTGTGFERCIAVNLHVCKAGDGSGGRGGEMGTPHGVATDGTANVYVGDLQNVRIQNFDLNGNFIRTWGKDVVDPISPSGDTGTGFEVCVGADGHICKSGSQGTLGGEMSFMEGIGTDGAGNVYVADSFNDRVQKFGSTGTFTRAWGKDVVDPSSPSGNTGTGFEICVAADGHICKVGEDDTTLGGEMNLPAGIAADDAGDLYVTDASNRRIQKFDSSGNFLRAWGRDVATAGPGNTGTAFEICVAANGDTCKAGAPDQGGGELNFPVGLATDTAANLYVADLGNQRIQRFADPVASAPPPPTVPPIGPSTAPAATGQRAAALKKCKKKKTARARKRCRKKAQALPI